MLKIKHTQRYFIKQVGNRWKRTIQRTSCFKKLNYLSFVFQGQLFRELYVKCDNKIASIIWISFNWHSFTLNDTFSLWTNYFVKMQLYCFSIQLYLR